MLVGFKADAGPDGRALAPHRLVGRVVRVLRLARPQVGRVVVQVSEDEEAQGGEEGAVHGGVNPSRRARPRQEKNKHT